MKQQAFFQKGCAVASQQAAGRPQQIRKDSRGQNLVEFALVLPVLLLILILLITVPGFGAWDYLVASNIADQAAQDGANAAAGAPFNQLQTIACRTATPEATQQMRQSALALQHVSVSCQVIDSANPSKASSYGVDNIRRVIVTINFSMRLFLPGAPPISAKVTGWARVEEATGP